MIESFQDKIKINLDHPQEMEETKPLLMNHLSKNLIDDMNFRPSHADIIEDLIRKKKGGNNN
jgi:hypothetical protein